MVAIDAVAIRFSMGGDGSAECGFCSTRIGQPRAGRKDDRPAAARGEALFLIS